MRYCPQCQSRYTDDQAICPLDATALLPVTDANINAASVDPLLGRVIADKYRVMKVLGRGGMGAVYEGQHLLLDRTVAIKVLRGNIAADERAATRFIREAKAAAKIEHPNAVTIYDFGVLQDGNAYLVMEFIRGCSLRQILYHQKQISAAQSVEWITQICGALEVAHQQGIIHRDLKPENIMLKENPDSTITVKVVDFGLAKLVTGDGEDASSKHLTQTGEVMGTPHYMAPEFYESDTIDKRADIYAIGVILYEMLTGDTPFTGTMQSVIGGHLFKKPEPLFNRQAGISPAMNEVVLAALHKQKDERIASAAELAQRLRQALAISQNTSSLAPHPAVTSDNTVTNNLGHSNLARNNQATNNLSSSPVSSASTTASLESLPDSAITPATKSPATVPPVMPPPPLPIMERATPVVERSTVANPSNYPTIPITDRVPIPASNASDPVKVAGEPVTVADINDRSMPPENVRSTVVPITSQATQAMTPAEVAEMTKNPPTTGTAAVTARRPTPDLPSPASPASPIVAASPPPVVAPAMPPVAAPPLVAPPAVVPVAAAATPTPLTDSSATTADAPPLPPYENLWDVLVTLQRELLVGSLVAALFALILVAVVIYRDISQQNNNLPRNPAPVTTAPAANATTP